MKAELLTGNIEVVSELLGDRDFESLGFMKNQGGSLRAYGLEEIRQILENDGDLIIATENGKIAGCAALAELPWDSDYFRRKMGAIKYFIINKHNADPNGIAAALVHKSLAVAEKKQLEFLLCKCGTKDAGIIHTLELHGFLLMDTLLNYMYDYNDPPFETIHPPQCPEEISLRLAVPDDQEELMMLAKTAFQEHFGRFHSDQKITREQAAGVYGQWLKSSCQGWADWIMVAHTKKQIVGFSVWKKPSQMETKCGIRLGHYSIGAVHPAYHKHGLFSLLTWEGMKVLIGRCAFIEGPTHINNYGVQKAYAKLGWTIRNAVHSFHKWL